jgi:hypothetical protein
MVWLLGIDTVFTANDFGWLGFGEVAVNFVRLVGEGIKAGDTGVFTTPFKATFCVAAPLLATVRFPLLLPAVFAGIRMKMVWLLNVPPTGANFSTVV